MDSFIMASSVVIPMAMMVAIGMLLRKVNLTDEPTMKKVDKLIFNVFMPLLSFYNIYKTDFTKLTNVSYIIFGCGLLTLLFIGAMVIVPKFVTAKNSAMYLSINSLNLLFKQFTKRFASAKTPFLVGPSPILP